MKEIKDIAIIGAGNVGSHLAKALKKSKVNITGVWSRQLTHSRELANSINCDVITSLESINPNNLDLAIVCVTDDAIASTLKKLSEEIPVAYTSGSVRLDQLNPQGKLGVFYPLQTFSKDRDIDLSNVPFLIESEDQRFGKALFTIAEKISSKVIYADSKDRYQLHIAAVMVNNFTNHIYSLADDHMKKSDLDFNLLRPLIQETVDKLNDLSPDDAQTGPAKRGDLRVIENHLSSLSGGTKEIYELLSDSIVKKYNS